MNATDEASDNRLLLGFTTVESEADADKLARGGIASGLAACVQIDGPVTSHFPWEGRQEKASEYRLLFKFVPRRQAALDEWIRRNHPYDTPEWVVVAAGHTSEKYLQWAREVTK